MLMSSQDGVNTHLCPQKRFIDKQEALNLSHVCLVQGLNVCVLKQANVRQQRIYVKIVCRLGPGIQDSRQQRAMHLNGLFIMNTTVVNIYTIWISRWINWTSMHIRDTAGRVHCLWLRTVPVIICHMIGCVVGSPAQTPDVTISTDFVIYAIFTHKGN